MQIYNIGADVFIHLTDGTINSFKAATETAAHEFVCQAIQDVHDIITDLKEPTNEPTRLHS